MEKKYQKKEKNSEIPQKEHKNTKNCSENSEISQYVKYE